MFPSTLAEVYQHLQQNVVLGRAKAKDNSSAIKHVSMSFAVNFLENSSFKILIAVLETSRVMQKSTANH